MSDGITDGRWEAKRMFEEWQKKETQKFLSNLSTKELVDELSKRDGLDFHKQLISQSRGKRVYRVTVFVTEDEE